MLSSEVKGRQAFGFAALSLGVCAVCLSAVYVLSYTPFILESYMPSVVRIGIEFLLLVLLLLISLRYQKVGFEIIWLLPIISLYILMIRQETHSFTQLVSSLNKLLFLVLMIVLLAKNRRALRLCMQSWVVISFVVCVISIIAFAGYLTGTIPFYPFDFGESVNGVQGSYYYLHNTMLGNLTPRTLFGFELARVVFYMYEPGLLAFYFGFNVLVARVWIDDPKVRQKFIWLNMIAGLLTLSTTFILFFAMYTITRIIVGRNQISESLTWLLYFMTALVVIAFFLDGIFSPNIWRQPHWTDSKLFRAFGRW